MTRPVLDFLRKVEDERRRSEEGETAVTPLATAVASAAGRRISEVVTMPVFRAPRTPPPPPGPPMQKIHYAKPADQVQEAKDLLGVWTFKEVGEKTFDYYLAYEGKDSG
ncbi:MAG: hypothetical protein ACR2KU_04645 [Gammaproteobacteria bacterium]|nr:hypothetical protein [Gammaproteobacteria bacterium]